MPFNIEVASKIVTLCSLAIAAGAAWIALPLDAQLKRLQAETQQLDNQLKVAASKTRDTEIQLKETETRLKEAESARKLSFDLYQEVKAILEKKEQAPRTEEALRVLIESLAEDRGCVKTPSQIRRVVSRVHSHIERRSRYAAIRREPGPTAGDAAARVSG
jgi:septal ring factor EnvC (AmiA/AmiB activator)